MKKLIALALVLIMCLSFAACGGASEEADIPTYTVITEATFPPFDTADDAGNIIGFDMDLIAAIGEDQGFNCEFVDMPFDSLIPAIQSGSGDIIAAFMWPGEERKTQVDFSTEYYHSYSVAVVKADNDTIKTEDDLTKDTIVCTQIGTVFADSANKWAEEGKINPPVLNDSFAISVLQLINGDVDAVISTATSANEYIAQHPDEIKVGAIVMQDIESAAAFAVQKGKTELLEQINTGLQNLVDNGKYDEICQKWGVDNTFI